MASAVQRLRALPAIEQAAYTADVPLTLHSGITTGVDLRIAERPGSFLARYEVNRVGPDYFATTGIALRTGREFRPEDKPGAPAVAIINEEFARRYLAHTDPIGQHPLLPGRDQSYPAEIVGSSRTASTARLVKSSSPPSTRLSSSVALAVGSFTPSPIPDEIVQGRHAMSRLCFSRWIRRRQSRCRQ